METREAITLDTRAQQRLMVLTHVPPLAALRCHPTPVTKSLTTYRSESRSSDIVRGPLTDQKASLSPNVITRARISTPAIKPSATIASVERNAQGFVPLEAGLGGPDEQAAARHRAGQQCWPDDAQHAQSLALGRGNLSRRRTRAKRLPSGSRGSVSV